MAEATISLSEIQAIDISPVIGKAQKMPKNCIHIVIENIILRKIHSKRLGNGEDIGWNARSFFTGLTSEVNVKSVIDDCFDGTYSNASNPHQSSTPILKNCDINGIDTTYGTSMGSSLVFLTPSRHEAGWQRAWRKLYQVRIMRRVWETLQSFCY